MRTESIALLTQPQDIRSYVDSLFSDGPIRAALRSGGWITNLVERFSRLPCLFFEASEIRYEWTQFSAGWNGILLCDYENPTIRDLRYLHEIYHAATLPHLRGLSPEALAIKNFQNEREASTYTEIAVYLECPDLRAQSFEHPIFADRLLFQPGSRMEFRPGLLDRWRNEPDIVFQELLYQRVQVVTAFDEDVDGDDPQIVWLRRYPDQGRLWLDVWADRYREVEDGMVTLRERCTGGSRDDAGKRHLEWLLSDQVADGTDVPFRREAVRFREMFDDLVRHYDEAMEGRGEKTVRHTTA